MQEHHLRVIEGSARGCEYICGTCVSSSRRRQLLNFNALWDYFVREVNSFLIKFLSKAWFWFTPPFLSRQKLGSQMFILCVCRCATLIASLFTFVNTFFCGTWKNIYWGMFLFKPWKSVGSKTIVPHWVSLYVPQKQSYGFGMTWWGVNYDF